MVIVSRTIEYTVQNNGTMNVTERHQCDDGREFMIVYVAQPDADLEAAADAHAANLLEGLDNG